MKRLSILLLALATLLALTSLAAADWRPEVRIPFVDAEGLNVDGHLDDDVWVTASLANAKAVVDLHYSNSRFSIETSVVYLAYDAENLYFGFINYDSSPRQLLEADIAMWGSTPGMEAGVRVAEGEERRSFQVYPNGLVQLAIGDDASVAPTEAMTTASSVFDFGWITELVVPFAALELDPPQVGDRWQFNLGGRSDDWKAWKSTGGSNQNLENAGTLVFGPAFE